MTELVNKKSKEGRYRVESNIAEIDPVVEPLTDLDDEDAIDRLLIDTGFDAEEEASALPPALDKTLPVHQDRAPQVDAFSNDRVLTALQIDDDEPIEPVDIGSPFADVELAPAPYAAPFPSIEPFIEHDDAPPLDDPGFSVFHDHAADWAASVPDAFASPAETNKSLDQAGFESPVPDVDLTETSAIDGALFEDHDELFEQEPEPNSLSQHPVNGEALVSGFPKSSGQSPVDEAPQADHPHTEKDTTLDAPAPPHAWGRLLSMQEDARQHMARLESRTRNARGLSYIAIALSLAALGGTLAVGYLDTRTRAELGRLKDMQSIMQEDMSGLNTKLDSAGHAAEENAEKLRLLSGEKAAKPEDKPITVEAPPPPAAASNLAKATPAPHAADKKPSTQSVRKTRTLPVRPAMNKTTLPKSSTAYRAKPATVETRGPWSINLASFRQIEDAKEQAAEYRKKGVSVKVTKVDIRQTTWYRLSVHGFKTKEAASTYSSRLKKQLRLNSIWIAAI